MKAKEIAAWMDGAYTYRRPWDVPHCAVVAIRDLIAERDRLRAALKRLVSAADCGAPDTDPIHPRLWAEARAALKEQP